MFFFFFSLSLSINKNIYTYTYIQCWSCPQEICSFGQVWLETKTISDVLPFLLCFVSHCPSGRIVRILVSPHVCLSVGRSVSPFVLCLHSDSDHGVREKKRDGTRDAAWEGRKPQVYSQLTRRQTRLLVWRRRRRRRIVKKLKTERKTNKNKKRKKERESKGDRRYRGCCKRRRKRGRKVRQEREAREEEGDSWLNGEEGSGGDERKKGVKSLLDED